MTDFSNLCQMVDTSSFSWTYYLLTIGMLNQLRMEFVIYQELTEIKVWRFVTYQD